MLMHMPKHTKVNSDLPNKVAMEKKVQHSTIFLKSNEPYLSALMQLIVQRPQGPKKEKKSFCILVLCFSIKSYLDVHLS